MRILREILYGMGHLQENRMVHADIRPSLIGVPIKREDNFRLLDRLGDSSSPTDVQLNHLKKRRELYLSPELFKGLFKGKGADLKYNPFKSDIFSLGLVILEAALFTSVQGIFDYSNGEIDKEELISLVEGFIQKYPENFILQEILMIMLEFSPKLRLEPITLLKAIRRMERIAKEKGEAMVSQINFHQDALVNQVEFTESGYKLKDSGKVQYSFYHKFEGNDVSSEVLQSEEIQTEFRTSLVKTIKDRGSQIGGSRQNEANNTIQKVSEDLDGESSNKISLKNVETNHFGGRNTLEKMIYENVGIDLSAQPEDRQPSKNNFNVETKQDLQTHPQDRSEVVDIQIEVFKKKSENVKNPDHEVSFGKNEDINQEPQVEQIEIQKTSFPNEINLVASDELSPEIQDLISSVNRKKNPINNEVHADYIIHNQGELMSSREFMNEKNTGPTEVESSQNEKKDSDFAREYELYEGKVQHLYNRWWNQNSERNAKHQLQPNPQGHANPQKVSQKEIDLIIEDKIRAIVNQEVFLQNSKKRIQKDQPPSPQQNNGETPLNKQQTPNKDPNDNIFHIDSQDPEYPTQVQNDQEVVDVQKQNNLQEHNFQGQLLFPKQS